MLDKDLQKHASEFQGYLDKNQYEVSDAGIYFPKAGAMAKGMYGHDVNGQDYREDHNLVPVEGLNHLLTTTLANGSKNSNWYLALYSGAYTPVSGLTAATFPAAASELTSNTEGYSETARRPWTPGAASNGTIDNTDAKAAFTIATAGSVTVNGAALLSASAKGATTGVLMSAAKFAATRTLYAGDVFNLLYRVNLTAG